MTHEEIEAYGYGNEIIFKNLEEKIMADIVRKIKTAGDLSGSTVYLMEQLSYMGYDIDSIKKMIQEALEESEEYVDKLYDDVLQHEYLGASPIFQAKEVPMIPFKQNPVMQNLLSFAKRSTNDEMKNMTRTMGFVKKTSDGTKAVELSKFYQETMDKALMEVATGTFSLDRALNDAVNTMVNSGVRWIDYDSGHHNRIAVAARRSVMSGLAHASQEQTLNMAKELDIHTFEVSAHMGARPTHAVWQGKVYTDEELESVCGLGEVTGLLGVNCYHNYYMFFEGVSKRTYTDEELERWKDDTPTEYEGKKYTNYEARQRMRQMETNMRAQKEKIKLLEKGGASKEVIQSAQARYRKQMSEYERFADAMNMKTQKNRITIGDGKTMKGVGVKQDKTFVSGWYNGEHYRKGSNEVDMNYINGSEYRRKFSRITNNSKVNDVLRTQSSGIMNYVKKTDTECLVIVDGDTGAIIFRKIGARNQVGVDLSDEEIEYIRNYQGKKISIHNHPTNLLPTGSDYASMGYRGYDTGILLTHDGRVFMYGIGTEVFRSAEYDTKLDELAKSMYNVMDDKLFEEIEKNFIERFRREKGISCVEL